MTFAPSHLTRWTMPDHYFGAEWPECYGSGFGRHRDSDDLAESNFETCLKALGGESETVKVVRESHWAVGWVEWIAIHESDDKALRIADDLKASCDDYPILDEEDFSKREEESANEIWRECYNIKERLDYIRKYRNQFDFWNYADLLANARGKYFSGYASGLINGPLHNLVTTSAVASVSLLTEVQP